MIALGHCRFWRRRRFLEPPAHFFDACARPGSSVSRQGRYARARARIKRGPETAAAARISLGRSQRRAAAIRRHRLSAAQLAIECRGEVGPGPRRFLRPPGPLKQKFSPIPGPLPSRHRRYARARARINRGRNCRRRSHFAGKKPTKSRSHPATSAERRSAGDRMPR